MQKNSVKKKLVSAKNKVVDNQTKIMAYALVFTTTVAVVQQMGIRSCNKFLEEKGLLDEYYYMGEFEE